MEGEVILSSINPFHTVIFPGLGSRRVSTTLGKYLFFSFHAKLNRPVHSDFVIIAARNVSTIGQIGPDKRGVNEV